MQLFWPLKNLWLNCQRSKIMIKKSIATFNFIFIVYSLKFTINLISQKELREYYLLVLRPLLKRVVLSSELLQQLSELPQLSSNRLSLDTRLTWHNIKFLKIAKKCIFFTNISYIIQLHLFLLFRGKGVDFLMKKMFAKLFVYIFGLGYTKNNFPRQGLKIFTFHVKLVWR